MVKMAEITVKDEQPLKCIQKERQALEEGVLTERKGEGGIRNQYSISRKLTGEISPNKWKGTK